MTIRFLALVLLIALQLMAQQPNSAAASLTMDGVNGVVGPFTASARSGATSIIRIGGAPGSPAALFAPVDGQLHPGALNTPYGLVDLSLAAGLITVRDGWSEPSISMSSLGYLELFFDVLPALPLGAANAIQAVVASPSSFFGLQLTAATSFTITTGPQPTTLSAGDDTSTPVQLGFAVPFYGQTYTAIFAGSNGNVTFGGGDTDFTASSGEMTTGYPRIAAFWTDLNPLLGGTLQATIDAAPPAGATPSVRVDYLDVRPYGNATIQYTFSIYLDAQGAVEISWSPNVTTLLYDVLCGIAAGQNTAPPGTMVDLTQLLATGPTTGGPYQSFFEWFGRTTDPYYTPGVNRPYDLAGRRLRFLPGGTGPSPAHTDRYVLY